MKTYKSKALKTLSKPVKTTRVLKKKSDSPPSSPGNKILPSDQNALGYGRALKPRVGGAATG